MDGFKPFLQGGLQYAIFGSTTAPTGATRVLTPDAGLIPFFINNRGTADQNLGYGATSTIAVANAQGIPMNSAAPTGGAVTILGRSAQVLSFPPNQFFAAVAPPDQTVANGTIIITPGDGV